MAKFQMESLILTLQRPQFAGRQHTRPVPLLFNYFCAKFIYHFYPSSNSDSQTFPLEDLCEGPFFTSKLFTHIEGKGGGAKKEAFPTFQGYKIELPLASHRPVWQLQNKIQKKYMCVRWAGF